MTMSQHTTDYLATGGRPIVPDRKPTNDLNARILRLFKNLVLSRGDLSKQVTMADEFESSEIDILQQKKIDSLYYLSRNLSAGDQQVYRDVWQLQREAFIELRNQTLAQGFEPILYKGAACFEYYCPGMPIGAMGDVDLFITRDRIPIMKKILRELGYLQADYDTETKSLTPVDPDTIARYEAGSYELFAFTKRVKLPDDKCTTAVRHLKGPLWTELWAKESDRNIFLTFDVHLAAGGGLPETIGTENPYRIPSTGLLIMDPTPHLWALMLRYYHEIAAGTPPKRRLRDIAYMALVLTRSEIDWSRFVELTAKLNVRPAVYYSLKFFERIGWIVPDPEIFKTLDPRRGSRARDFGWQYSKMFGQLDKLSLPRLSVADIEF